MQGFNAQELGYKGTPPSADEAVEEANYWYSRIYYEDTKAGLEIPVKDVPIELGEDAIYSVEAGEKCIRDANKRSYSFSALARHNYDRIFRRR